MEPRRPRPTGRPRRLPRALRRRKGSAWLRRPGPPRRSDTRRNLGGCGPQALSGLFMGAAMKGKALLGGLKRYATWLVVTLLFPLLWLKAFRLARRHTDEDPRGPMKVGAAIVVSVVILEGGWLALMKREERAAEGRYEDVDIG